MGDNLVFQYVCILHFDQIRMIRISITLNIYHFFVVRTFNIFFFSYSEMCVQCVAGNCSFPSVLQLDRREKAWLCFGSPIVLLTYSSSHLMDFGDCHHIAEFPSTVPLLCIGHPFTSLKVHALAYSGLTSLGVWVCSLRENKKGFTEK